MCVDYDKIGKRIKATREEKKISIKDMSLKLDIPEIYIEELEQGNAKISLAKFIELCNFLDISIYEVLNTKYENINNYMDKELYELIIGCTKKKQKLIYSMVQLMIKTQIA